MAHSTIELDVRPHLKNKLEPFELIMDTVKSLSKDDVFILQATFKPTPLLGVMKLKGYANKVTKVADDHWTITFVHKSHKELLEQIGASDDDQPAAGDGAAADNKQDEGRIYELDNRGLEPPQPMVRTLGQLEKMKYGDVLVITNDRVPVFLIEELNNLGYPFEVEELGVGEQARITIRKTS